MDTGDERSTWSFIRGYFDSGAGAIYPGARPSCVIESTSPELLHDIAAFCKIPCTIQGSDRPSVVISEWHDTNCIDFLSGMYDRSLGAHDAANFESYLRVLHTHHSPVECLVQRAHPDAVLPSKLKASDVGYDLTIIKEHQRLTANVVLFDTGIKISVQNGWYAEVVPRSSLSKSGYMLANSVGIIDRSYTGTILVALAKIDPHTADVELPFRCCQLVLRPQVHAAMVETVVPFGHTARDEGGFGSSDRDLK
ncbi:Deoxyuridine 5'-triphosphate nucleotidohydrolase [Tetrabaena socialis]|uniref:Deoxyuridine 5'-triphosphate nucleotidohydrolase n=1 Tax=Tetrabaena socialis TaxID=47790 RepID=A0A2J7ZJR7_9CHLO|nr:Deoxyuridine 5'-triphosphate nucleotidohydrolase [Tetrabaena socialis]|eukprot:PNH00511.1 Deoxyuridine 5'-triphosphate nucleotidohydrolase [Tetrabaena socialis]